MFWMKDCKLKRGMVVKFKSIDTEMEVTYIKRHFNHNRVEVIYSSNDGKMSSMGWIHEDSLYIVFK